MQTTPPSRNSKTNLHHIKQFQSRPSAQRTTPKNCNDSTSHKRPISSNVPLSAGLLWRKTCPVCPSAAFPRRHGGATKDGQFVAASELFFGGKKRQNAACRPAANNVKSQLGAVRPSTRQLLQGSGVLVGSSWGAKEQEGRNMISHNVCPRYTSAFWVELPL